MENQKQLTVLLLALSALLLIIITKGKKIMEATANKVWDWISETRINTLHPLIRDKVRQFINEAERQGIQLRVTEATRSFEKQNNLYAQGRTKPGKIVTNAKGGESYHNYGLAFDVVEIKNGAANWNADWEKIGAIGKSFGFEWGGDFHSIKDKPHFQETFGNSIAMLQNRYNNGNIFNGYVALA